MKSIKCEMTSIDSSDKQSTCSDCISHPYCVYVSSGTWSMKSGSISVSHSFETDGSTGGICWPGSPIAASHTSKSLVVDGHTIATMTLNPDKWCWIQCGIPGVWGRVVLVSVIIIGATLLVVFVKFIIRRRRRARDSRRYFRFHNNDNYGANKR